MRQKQRMSLALAALVVCLFASVVCVEVLRTRSTERPEAAVLAQPVEVTGAANLVSGIYLNYRLYDTLFEVLVFSVAVLGVRRYLDFAGHGSEARPRLAESEVVKISALFLAPVLFLMMGLQAITGHVSPGGGFSAGVIGASGLLFLAIAFGMDAIRRQLDHPVVAASERLLLLVLLALILAPSAFGKPPLTDLLPKGVPGSLLSGGTILIYNVLIAAKVLIGAWIIIESFAEHRGEL